MKRNVLNLSLLFFIMTRCYSQRTQQEYITLLSNNKQEWKWNGTTETLGRAKICTKGEYIRFLNSPNELIKRSCNDKGSWDTTKLTWTLISMPGSKWYLKIGDSTYRLFIKDEKETYTLTLTYKEKNGDIKKAGTDKVYISYKE